MCPIMSIPEVARDFNELKNAVGSTAAYDIWSKNNGNGIDKAPNGEPSILFQTLLDHFDGDREKAIKYKAKVYKKSFLSWFGDWINDPKNASKVVDKNGEPLIVYHGNRTEESIKEFKNEKLGTEHKERNIKGFWFITDQRLAKEEYALKPESVGRGVQYLQYGEVLPVFLNIKSPIIETQRDIEESYNPYFGKYTHSSEELSDFFERIEDKTGKSDGYIVTIVDSDNASDDFRSKQTQLLVADPNQIKSIHNIGTFSDDVNIYNILDIAAIKFRRKLKPKSKYLGDIRNLGAFLAERFIDPLGSSLASAIYSLYDENEPIEKFYDKVEFFVNNELGQFLTDEIERVESQYKQQVYKSVREAEEEAKQAYFRDLILLREGKITGDFQKDSEQFGKDVAESLKQRFPAIYEKGYSRRLANYYRHISNLQSTVAESKRKAERNNLVIFKLDKKLEKLKTIQRALHETPARVRDGIKSLINQEIINFYSNLNRIKSSESDNNKPKSYDYSHKYDDETIGFDLNYVFPRGLDAKYTIKELLENVQRFEPEYSELCKKLLENIKGDANVLIKSDASRKSVGGTTWATFDRDGEDLNGVTILLNRESNLFKQDPAYVVMHEIMHTVSSSYLRGNEEFYESINSYIQYIKHTVGDYNSFGVYGLENPAEFIAEYFSNPSFQEWLKTIPAMDNKKFVSLFIQILDNILLLLGINRNDNAYEQIHDVAEYVIDCTMESYYMVDILENRHFEGVYLNGYNEYKLEVKQFSVHEYLSQQGEYVLQSVKDFLKKNTNVSLSKIKNLIHETKQKFNNQRQKQLLHSTQQSLIDAFGLTLQIDEEGNRRYVSAKTEDGKYDLIVEFVAHLEDEEGEAEGWYDYNAKSAIAHHVIKVATGVEEMETVNHELAHHYLRMFWNSPVVQNALGAVYKKGMTADEVEEALVEQITKNTNVLFSGEQEIETFGQLFWGMFNQMLYDAFGVMTKTQRDRLTNNVTAAFVINEQQTELNRSDFQKHNGRMYSSASKRLEKIRKARMEAKAKKFQNTYNVADDVRKDQQAIQTIVSEIFSRQRMLGQHGSISGKLAVKLNNNVEIVKRFLQAIENQRNVEKQRLMSSGINEEEAKKLSANTTEELIENLKLISDTLQQGFTEMQEVLEQFTSAEAFRFRKIAYRQLLQENGDYERQYITNPTDVDENTITEDYDEDKLQVYGKSVIDYYSTIIDNLNDFVSSVEQTELYNQSAVIEYFGEDEIDIIKGQLEEVKISLGYLSGKYNNAVTTKTINILNDYIDNHTSTLTEKQRENFKNVVSHWVRSSQWDVSKIEQYIGIAEYSKSPIVRIVHAAIVDAAFKKTEQVEERSEQLRVAKKKAIKALIKSGNKKLALKAMINIDKMFMEKDSFGLPSYNFLSELDKTKYDELRNQYFNEVFYGKGWDEKIGDTIIHHESLESQIQKALGDGTYQLMLNEKGEPEFDNYIDCEDAIRNYLKAKNAFDKKYLIRQFSDEYYEKRLELMSPYTLHQQKIINDDIDTILRFCMINGKPHTENLNSTQMAELKKLYRQKQILGSPYNQYGEKLDPSSIEYKTYLEIKAWNDWVGDRVKYKKDEAYFNEAMELSENKDRFMKRNSYRVVSSKFWEDFQARFGKNTTDKLDELKSKRRALHAIIKDQGLVKPSFDIVWDDEKGQIRPEYEQYFLSMKEIDKQISEEKAEIEKKHPKSAKQKEEMSKMLKRNYVLKRVYDEDHDKFVNQAWIDYMTDRIYERWEKSGEANWKRNASLEVKKFLYFKSSTGVGANEPLSIFKYSIPVGKQRKFHGTGEEYDTQEYTPINVYTVLDKENTDPSILNPKWKDDSEQRLQLNQEEFKNEEYEKLSNYPQEVLDYFNLLKQTTKDAYDLLPFNGEYTGQLSQVGASTSSMISRYITSGQTWRQNPLKALFGGIKYGWKRYVGINEQDGELNDAYVKQKRKTDLPYSIPIRFVHRLQNSQEISSNLLGSTIALYDMAVNYSVNREIAPLLRVVYQSSLINKDGSTQSDVLRNLITKNVFDKKLQGINTQQSAIKRAIKYSGIIKSLAMMGLLGGSTTSGFTAAADAFMSYYKDVMVGKFINSSDFYYTVKKLIYGIPGALYQIGSTNTSSSAIVKGLEFFGLSEDAKHKYQNADKNRLRRVLNPEYLMFSIFKFADTNATSHLMISTCHNIKLYPGTDEFFTEREFLQRAVQEGKSSIEAQEMYRNACCLWDGLTDWKQTFNINSKNEAGKALKRLQSTEEGKKYISKLKLKVHKRVRSRSSFYNGMTYAQNRTQLQDNPMTGWITMVRNFMLIMFWVKFGSANDVYEYSSGDISEREQDRVEVEQHYNYGKFNFMQEELTAPELQGAFNAITHKRLEDLDTENNNFVKGIGNFAKRCGKNILDIVKYWWFSKRQSGNWRRMYREGLTSERQIVNVSEKGRKYREQHNISETEMAAVSSVLTTMILLCLVNAFSALFHNTGVDDWDDNLAFQTIDTILLRLPIEMISGYTPATILELINSVTAGKSPMDHLSTRFLYYDVWVLMWDFMSGDRHEDLYKVSHSPMYKGLPQYQVDLINLLTLGGMRNLYKSTHVDPTKASKRFYQDLNLYIFPNPSHFWKDSKNPSFIMSWFDKQQNDNYGIMNDMSDRNHIKNTDDFDFDQYDFDF